MSLSIRMHTTRSPVLGGGKGEPFVQLNFPFQTATYLSELKRMRLVLRFGRLALWKDSAFDTMFMTRDQAMYCAWQRNINGNRKTVIRKVSDLISGLEIGDMDRTTILFKDADMMRSYNVPNDGCC